MGTIVSCELKTRAGRAVPGSSGFTLQLPCGDPLDQLRAADGDDGARHARQLSKIGVHTTPNDARQKSHLGN